VTVVQLQCMQLSRIAITSFELADGTVWQACYALVNCVFFIGRARPYIRSSGHFPDDPQRRDAVPLSIPTSPSPACAQHESSRPMMRETKSLRLTLTTLGLDDTLVCNVEVDPFLDLTVSYVPSP